MGLVAKITRESHVQKGRGSLVRSLASKTSKGFTLIELLVVIAIISVLTSIVLASLSTTRSRGRDGRRISDLKQIQLALTLYYDANREFPIDIYDGSLTGAGFIPSMPRDPRTNNEYAYVALQGAAINNSICASYHLGTRLEQYSTAAGSPFQDAYGGEPGGTYGTGTSNGPVCSGSEWGGNSDVAADSQDFDATDPATTHIYDVRP